MCYYSFKKAVDFMFNYNKFRELRKKNNYNQFEVAMKLNVSPSAIGMYEQGRRQPDNEIIKRIANLFNVSTDYLLDNDNVSKTIENQITDPELNQTLKTLAENEFDRTLFKKYGELSEEKKKIVMSVINSIIDDVDKE